jgi:hypothetical protein
MISRTLHPIAASISGGWVVGIENSRAGAGCSTTPGSTTVSRRSRDCRPCPTGSASILIGDPT